MSVSCFQVEHCKVMLENKHVLDKQLSISLCFNFVHYVQKIITRFRTAYRNIREFE